MKQIRVADVARPLKKDVDSTATIDVSEIDAVVSKCVSKAVEALTSALPVNYSEFERDQLIHLVNGIRHSHDAIKRLTDGRQNASAVDALTIARLQVEAVFNVAFLLQDSQNMRVMLKNNWKKKYVRFLLERAEQEPLSKFEEFYNTKGVETLERLQALSFVSDEERRCIELQELGIPFGPAPRHLVQIPSFPTPGKVIGKVGGDQAKMLERLYFEYQFLCSFAHGDIESGFFRAISDPRSSYQRDIGVTAIQQFYERQVLTAPRAFSFLSAILVATEIAAVYPAHVEIRAMLADVWNLAISFDLIAQSMWNLRAKRVLGAFS